MREFIKLHIEDATTDIAHLEGKGALYFLALDDLSIREEGEEVGPLLKRVEASGSKRVILTDRQQVVHYVLDADAFLRTALFSDVGINPLQFCRRPIVIKDPGTPSEDASTRLNMHPLQRKQDVIDRDIILPWSEKKKGITGSDILGRLLRDVVTSVVPRAVDLK